MEHIDYKLFKKINGITNLNIAEYLGVSEAYVSMVTSGKTRFSEERLAKLIDHPLWETYPLLNRTQETTPTYEHPFNLAPTQQPTLPLPVAESNTPDDIEEVEAVEIPIVPTAVVRQPDTRLSKWVTKYAGDAECLRFGEILANATIAREVKEPDMSPALKIGQYICLELLPHDTPIKNGRIYFIDHSQLGGFFRKLYDRGEQILCKAYNPTYEDFVIEKAHIYDLYRIVGVFSTDVIEDVRDEQIDHFMEQTNHLIRQHDAHNANTAKLIEQQGALIELLKERK